jgi:hypothetical protein
MAEVFYVNVLNTGPLKRAMAEGVSGNVLRPAFTAGAVIVEAQAKRDVHQVSGKLHDSTGTEITGAGWNTEAHVGPRPGYGGPRTGRSGAKGLRQNPKRRVNRSDPRDYAARYQFGFHGDDSLGRHYDQHGNRYLVEALLENEQRIVEAVATRIAASLAKSLG